MSYMQTDNRGAPRTFRRARGHAARQRSRKRRPLKNLPRPNGVEIPAIAPTSIGRGNFSSFTKVEPIDCSLELRWLAEHSREYAGQWVALDGDRLLAHGESAREVYEAVHASEVRLPLVVLVEAADQNLPFGGW
jgi:hypothetical protein